MNDSNGERTMKLWGNTVPMDVNAGENRFANFNEYTVYPSPYVVADVHGYTKHYYAGTERLCSRIGGGGLQELHYSPVDDGYVEKKEDAYRNQINEDLRCAGARAETKGLYFEVLNRFIENLSPEEGIYYYHPDHLGSASWITDRNGRPIQHMQYLPYGETKLDQRTSSYQERYTFSGKEKDSETGYYYFGARYYNSDLSLWLSVDPMSDKYPSLSPYNYCAWNPMKLVDPDGAELETNTDWYKDRDGHVHWNANVHSQSDLKDGETYLGRTTTMIAEGEDMMMYGDQYGHKHSSIPLREITVTETLTDFERTMQNPIVQSIHQSASDFWTNPVTLGVVAGITSVIGISEITLAVSTGDLLSGGVASYAVGKSSSRVSTTAKHIKDWIGDGRCTINKSGDPIFTSKDNLRKFRIDMNNTGGDRVHMHLERKTPGGNWKDATSTHRLYPK